jgi:hypothetical protein
MARRRLLYFFFLFIYLFTRLSLLFFFIYLFIRLSLLLQLTSCNREEGEVIYLFKKKAPADKGASSAQAATDKM